MAFGVTVRSGGGGGGGTCDGPAPDAHGDAVQVSLRALAPMGRCLYPNGGQLGAGAACALCHSSNFM